MVPASRVRALNAGEFRPDGDYVLYWMVATRRLGWSFSLQRSVELAVRFGRPLLILEALRVGYPIAIRTDSSAVYWCDALGVRRVAK